MLDCSLYMEEGVEVEKLLIALYIWKRELKLKSKCYDCSLYMEEGVEVESKCYDCSLYMEEGVEVEQ